MPQVSAGTKLIQIPVNKVALGDTTSVTFIEVLGVRNSIALTSSIEYISSPCIQQEEANSVLAGTGKLMTDEANICIKSHKINPII